MPESALDIVILVGCVPSRTEGLPLRPFVDRLAYRGISARVLCVENEGQSGLVDLIECPGLARRWLRPLAVRGLTLGADRPRPRLLHVIESELADVGLDLAESWGIPYVLTVEEFLAPGDRLRLSRSLCRGLVTVCPELAEELQRDLGVPSDLIHVIPRGLTVTSVHSPTRSPSRVPVIGASGPLTFRSGFASFLTAARRVIDAGVDVEVVIAGTGDEEIELRRRADRLRITHRVTFAGEPAVGERFWDVLDVFCMTSLNPTVGRSLAMAQAHGVPCIATDIEGLRALVEPGVTGLRVPPNDSNSLAQAILELLGNPEMAAQLGDQGRKSALVQHDPEQEADRLELLYRSIIAEAVVA